MWQSNISCICQESKIPFKDQAHWCSTSFHMKEDWRWNNRYEYCATNDMLADVFTKVLVRDGYHKLIKKLGLKAF